VDRKAPRELRNDVGRIMAFAREARTRVVIVKK